MSWTLIKRKCHICKKDIILDQDNAIYLKEKYYHFDCFVEFKLTRKRNKLNKDEIIKEAIETQKVNSELVKNIVSKEKLYKWLQYNYNVVVLTKPFFIKMDSIYDGTYKGLSKGIPANDLLDMWQRKKSELDKISDSKKRKGEEINGLGRIQYDLAVLLSKYDSYLKWKEKQKVLEQEQLKRVQESQEQKINYTNISKNLTTQNKDENNIDDILNEIF